MIWVLLRYPVQTCQKVSFFAMYFYLKFVPQEIVLGNLSRFRAENLSLSLFFVDSLPRPDKYLSFKNIQIFQGILPPDSGDASICTITFDLNINKEVVSKFNFGVKQGSNYVNPLDDLILILKLRNGPDHYITLSGNWTYSAFGMPFIALTHSFFKDVSISSLEYPATSLVLNQLGNFHL